MELDNAINIVLTAMIAISVFFQARYAKQHDICPCQGRSTGPGQGNHRKIALGCQAGVAGCAGLGDMKGDGTLLKTDAWADLRRRPA